jgi:type II secretory pathway predicted ATPase ExeA
VGTTPSADCIGEGHPFNATPDLPFFYISAATEAVRDGLLSDVLGRKGLRLLVGEPGTGKTTLLLDLKQKLEAANCLVVLTRGTKAAFDELLDACCEELGRAASSGNRMERIRALAELLVQRLEAGATTALLIDDAQVLSDDALEDLSWLTDLEKDGHKLIQLVLAGQPDLVPRLCGSRLLFVQDSAIEYSGLKPLNPQEVASYIRHRLAAAEFEDPDLFSTEAIERIARYAEGVPRLINQLCAMTMQLVKRERGDAISGETVEAAIAELLSSPQSQARAGDPSEGQLADKVLGDHAAAPEAAGARSDSDRAGIRTSNEQEAETSLAAPLDLPAQPMPDEGSTEDAQASGDAAAGSAREVPDGPPIYGDPRNGPTLAPFPKNLTIPPAGARPARQRRAVAMLAVLVLAGLFLGGAGMFLFQGRAWLSDETSGPPVALSDGMEAQPTPAEAGAARDAARAPEPRRLSATPADQPAPPRPPAVSAPNLDVPRASGKEDQAIPLDIHAAAGAAAALSVAVSGLPDGARLTAGRDSGDDIWSLSRQELAGLMLMPAPNFSGRLRLTVDASARWPDGRITSASKPLIVEVVATADPPILDVAEATARGNGAIPLDIYAALADVDGSESLMVTISGLPDGAGLSAGHDDGAGRWRLTPKELLDITLTPPTLPAQSFELAVVATAREADGDSASTTALLKVDVARAPPAVADGKGDFVLQLAALRSIGDAEREVVRLRDRFQKILGDAPLKIYQAEVNGVPYYRLRTEPVPNKAKVFQICAQLKQEQQDCMVLQQIAEAQPIAAGAQVQPTGSPSASLLPSEATLALAEASAPKLASATPNPDIAVRDLVMARDVVEREPAEPTTAFSPRDGRAFAHAKIYNPSTPTEVSFVWLYDDALYARVPMEVGTSVRWRTWSSAEVWLGKWRVQIVSADGQVLAETAFTVQ